MFLIKIHAKIEFFIDQNQNKEIHKFYFLTVQENVAAIFVNAKIFNENFLNLWDFL